MYLNGDKDWWQSHTCTLDFLWPLCMRLLRSSTFNHFILMFTECTDEQIQMKEKQEEKQEELERLKTLLAQKEQENDLLRMKIRTCQVPYPLTAEVINNSSVPNYFQYCTGFTYDEFNKLCTFFTLPDNDTAPQTHIPLIYDKLNWQIQHMPLRQQFQPFYRDIHQKRTPSHVFLSLLQRSKH